MSDEVKVQRTVPATVDAVFDAWLNPKTPGTPWNLAGKLLFHPAVGEHTWASPNTSGLESVVTVTLSKHEEGTVMTPSFIPAFPILREENRRRRAGTTFWACSLGDASSSTH